MMNRYPKTFLSLLLLALFISPEQGWSQKVSKRVLFLGNSYTYYNNMPVQVAEMAKSVGDRLFFESNTPGGYTLEGHSTNQTTLDKIAEGNWDFVVLQDQSQRPSFKDNYVQARVYPFAKKLDSLIRKSSPCARTTFYMTWGRKNGDASNCNYFKPLCTYRGMDSMLRLRYEQMASDNKGIVSPVSVVWRYIRENHPGIELYNPDQSHPSPAGSYAAACCFYTAFFRKDPNKVTYNDKLDTAQARIIRSVVKNLVFDSLMKWQIGEYDVQANFSHSQNGKGTLDFKSTSRNASRFIWTMDGQFYTDSNITHVFSDTGYFTVKLMAMNDCDTSISEKQVYVTGPLNIHNLKLSESFFYPNPSGGILRFKQVIPQFIAIYDLSGKMVLSPIQIINSTANISQLSPGIYYLKADFGGLFKVGKLVVE